MRSHVKLKILILMIFPVTLTLFLCREGSVSGKSSSDDIKIAEYKYSEFENPLPVPPLLKNTSSDSRKASFTLNVQSGETEFFKGVSVYTLGYNGSFLGPTIRMRRGQTADIKVNNHLREVTTVHWHGMLVPGEMDGGPHQIIAAGGTWHPVFKVHQQAATAWYHPHGHGTTALQVYKGLAGMIIIDDEVSDRLDIPKDYGVNDIPLIVQDRRFTSEGVPVYMTSMRDMMEGMKGNTIIVNGVVNAVLKADMSKYRFRLLNGSNARVYDFRFSDGIRFSQIATDGGFIEKPYGAESLRLSPGERAEIIVDFSGQKKGKELFILSGDIEIMKIVITGEKKDTAEIPDRLADIERISTETSKGERYFSLLGMGHGVNINGKKYYSARIDETVKLNSVEIWNIRSMARHMGMMGGGMMGGNVYHNFHAHGIQFMIIERGERPVSPSESGWKDTVLLEEGETVKVIIRFLYKGLFMYHCHILEHEDNGMMGQFMVK